MLPNIIFNVIFLIVARIFRSIRLKRFENIKSMKQLLGLSSGLCTIWIFCVMKMEHSQTIWFCRDSFLWPCYFEKTWLLCSYAWSITVFMSILTFVLNLMDLNIHATIRKITLIIILGSIPHKKLCLYHLPTRGRAWIKLGDAWYVSNVSIIFDCSMLLYYPSRMFYMHLYAILYDFLGMSFLWLCYFEKT